VYNRLRLGRYRNPILVGERTKSSLHAEYVCPSLQLCQILRGWLRPHLCWSQFADYIPWTHIPFFFRSGVPDWKMIEYHIISYHIPHFIEPICSPRCRNRSPSCSFYPQVSDHRSSLIDGSPVDRSIPSGLRALGSLATLSTQKVQLGRAGRFETHKNTIETYRPLEQ
jgi:hypothetical protein